jgi:hypothetical protein
MSTKLIITERQLESIKNHLTESSYHESLVEKIVNDLNTNYEPMIGIVREDGEYHENPMVKIKVDGGEIEVADLYEYMKKKYKLGDEFIKQVIKDWMFGTVKDGNKLSKNVAIN